MSPLRIVVDAVTTAGNQVTIAIRQALRIFFTSNVVVRKFEGFGFSTLTEDPMEHPRVITELRLEVVAHGVGLKDS